MLEVTQHISSYRTTLSCSPSNPHGTAMCHSAYKHLNEVFQGIFEFSDFYVPVN